MLRSAVVYDAPRMPSHHGCVGVIDLQGLLLDAAVAVQEGHRLRHAAGTFGTASHPDGAGNQPIIYRHDTSRS